MRQVTTKTMIGMLIIVAAFAFQTVSAPTAYAKYNDRSDELPGMDTDITPYVIGAVALIGGILILKALDKDNDQGKEKPAVEQTESTASESEAEENTSEEASEDSSYRKLLQEDDSKKLNLYFDIDRSKQDRIKSSAFDVSDMTFKVGVKLGF